VSPCRLAECEDLRLLLRLIHSMRGYTSDGPRPLSLAEVVRLLVLAGKLQVEPFAVQCVDKVGTALSEEDPGPSMEVLEWYRLVPGQRQRW
jgi:hypothetical protein